MDDGLAILQALEGRLSAEFMPSQCGATDENSVLFGLALFHGPRPGLRDAIATLTGDDAPYDAALLIKRMAEAEMVQFDYSRMARPWPFLIVDQRMMKSVSTLRMAQVMAETSLDMAWNVMERYIKEAAGTDNITDTHERFILSAYMARINVRGAPADYRKKIEDDVASGQIARDVFVSYMRNDDLLHDLQYTLVEMALLGGGAARAYGWIPKEEFPPLAAFDARYGGMGRLSNKVDLFARTDVPRPSDPLYWRPAHAGLIIRYWSMGAPEPYKKRAIPDKYTPAPWPKAWRPDLG